MPAGDPSLVIVVYRLGPLLTVCCGSVLARAPLTSDSMDVCSRLHPPCRSVVWIPVLPSSIVAPMKWCTDFVVRRTLVLGGWPVGAMILFLEVALLGTWLCHLHAPSVMLHKVTCSVVSRSVPPSQNSVNSGVVDVRYIQIPSHSGCRIHGCSIPLLASTPFALSSPMSLSLGKLVSALFLSVLQLSALPPHGAPQHVSLTLQLSALHPQGAPQHLAVGFASSSLSSPWQEASRRGLRSSSLSFPWCPREA